MLRMNLFHLLLSTAVVSTASAQQCEAPSQGCTYGMFNYEKCLCECIKPFCRDANGDCVVPLDNCGGNPWSGCTRGVNCPWWGSLSSGDVCNTGENVSCSVCVARWYYFDISYVVWCLYAASNSVDFSFWNISEHGDGRRQYVVYEMLPLCCHVHLLPSTPSL